MFMEGLNAAHVAASMQIAAVPVLTVMETQTMLAEKYLGQQADKNLFVAPKKSTCYEIIIVCNE
jgi:hypothetical protein